MWGHFPAMLVATKLGIFNETVRHIPTVCGNKTGYFFKEMSGHFPIIFVAKKKIFCQHDDWTFSGCVCLNQTGYF